MVERSDASQDRYSGPSVPIWKRWIHGWTFQAFPIGSVAFARHSPQRMRQLTIFILVWGRGPVMYCYRIAITILGSSLELKKVKCQSARFCKTHADLFSPRTVLFTINACLFTINVFTCLLQVLFFRKQFLRLVKDPVRGVFVPLSSLNFAIIIIGFKQYLVIPGCKRPASLNLKKVSWAEINQFGSSLDAPWEAVHVALWLYIGISLAICLPMLMVWFNKKT